MRRGADVPSAPRRSSKAFVDPKRSALQPSVASGSPCAIAWRIAEYREQVYRWLGSAGRVGDTIVLPVMMPEKVRRDAVFRRELRTVAGEALIVAVDVLTRAVFAGRSVKRV